MKCAGNHPTEKCLKSRNDGAAKCSNCNGDHPASYRGCHVHKELQKKMYPALRYRITNRADNLAARDVPNNSEASPAFSRHDNSGPPYAQAARQGLQSQQNVPLLNQKADDMAELKSMMKDLMTQMSSIISIVTTLVAKMK